MVLKFAGYLMLFVFSLVQIPSCKNQNSIGKQDEVKEIFNRDSKVELLFFYKKEATYEQRKYFDENILMKNTDRGQYMREGVKAVFGIDKDGYIGFGITFLRDATKEQREDIKKILTESPLVYRVFEDVVPNEIKLE
ncbi:MAG: hypothetical protein DYH05_08465 [Acidobacteria bacterium ACB1]|nr:hypothetical protein [Pyrinomonadaceae bacterium]MCE7962514.1 hypothetical protein [Acidobacteria bacterium ACB1]RIJ91560.1 MAG: hypothetical protein DCC44_09290 [Acidobacteriota bacterium]